MDPILSSVLSGGAQFNLTLHELSCHLYKEIINLFPGGNFDSNHLLSRRRLQEFDQDTSCLIYRLHRMVLQHFGWHISSNHSFHPSMEDLLLIPVNEVDRLSKSARALRKNNYAEWQILCSEKEEPIKRSIHEFVEYFNLHFQNIQELRQEAETIVQKLKQQTWVSTLLPKGDTIPVARIGLYQLFRCNDPVIKELALFSLTELLESDPLEMNSAHQLVELQSLLLNEIRAIKAQDLNTYLQRRLIKAYAISIECILLHAGAGNLNAMADETKQEHWTGAEELKQLNVSKDPEIKFWAKYAIQGIQHIKSDKTSLQKVLERLGHIAKASFIITIVINNPEDSIVLVNDAFQELVSALKHIEIYTEWFEELLVLKKLCRFAINDPIKFRNLSTLLKEKKNGKTDSNVLYGIVSILEYTIVNSRSKEVREESLKLLLHYFSLDCSSIRSRIIEIIHLMCTSSDSYLKHTGYSVKQLLAAAGKLPLESSPIVIKVDKRYIYENVLKFLLVRLAEIKGGSSVSGHSMLTLLCTSEEERIVPPLLSCLTTLCPDFREPDIHGNTVYHLLVRQGYYSAMRYILPEMGINIDAQEVENGYTPLHDAVMLQSLQGVSVLLELGANPDIQDHHGNTPLHYATLLDDKLVEALLEKQAKPNIPNGQGKFPLNLAVEQGFSKRIKLLVSAGGTTVENVQGVTPLIKAILLRSFVSIKALIRIQKGEITDDEAFELIHLLREFENFFDFHRRMLDEYEAYKSSIEDALANRNKRRRRKDTELIRLAKDPLDIKSFKKHLHKTNNVNEANSFGQTALHLAILNLNVEALKSLLRAKVDVNSVDINGNPPLHYAAYKGSAKMISILLKGGAKIQLRNHFGESPLHIACGILPDNFPACIDKEKNPPEPSLNAVKLLIDQGYQPKEKDTLGNNALHHAVIARTRPIIKWLYKRYPRIKWEKNLMGLIPAEYSVHLLENIENEPEIMERLNSLHQKFVKHTRSKLTLGNLLVSANKVAAFRELVKEDQSLAVYPDKTKMEHTPLHRAAIEGNCDVLRIYIENEFDLNIQDAMGNTAAHITAAHGHTDFLKLLKKHHANLLIKNRDGRIPLHVAATKMCTGVIEVLKSKRAQEEVDNRGDTALHIACGLGRIAIVSALWDGVSPVNDDGNTPLHEACLNSQELVVKFLIEKGVEIEARNASGQTPLMLAAQEGNPFTISLFLRVGANLWVLDDEGETALHKATFNHHYEAAIKLIANEKERLNPPKWNLVTCSDLLEETPLHELPKKKPLVDKNVTVKLLSELLIEGADPYARNYNGELFIHVVAYYGRVSLFDELLVQEPKHTLNPQDYQGNTPLHKAVEGHQLSMVKALCKHTRCSVDVVNNQGLTPLLLAIQEGFWIGARILIEYGANPCRTTKEGKSIFHLIFMHKELNWYGQGLLADAVQTYPKLLRLKTENDWTPLHFLASRGHCELLFILRYVKGSVEEKEEYLWAKTHDGQTAIDLANREGHIKLAKNLLNFHPESMGADYPLREEPLKGRRAYTLWKKELDPLHQFNEGFL